MGTDPAHVITHDQMVLWLEAIASGVLDLSRDNETMARDETMARAVLAFMERHKPAQPDQPEPLPPGNLTPNFTLAEFMASDTAAMRGIDNTPNADEVDELGETALLMENIRTLCGDVPVLISSGYRCPELNAAVGGASNSAHLYGCAADFTVPQFGTPLEVARAIEPHMNEWGVDQLIYESGWVHIGRAIPPSTPRNQCLTIDSRGTQHGIVA